MSLSNWMIMGQCKLLICQTPIHFMTLSCTLLEQYIYYSKMHGLLKIPDKLQLDFTYWFIKPEFSSFHIHHCQSVPLSQKTKTWPLDETFHLAEGLISHLALPVAACQNTVMLGWNSMIHEFPHQCFVVSLTLNLGYSITQLCKSLPCESASHRARENIPAPPPNWQYCTRWLLGEKPLVLPCTQTCSG